ncbi:MAG: guanylate kinase [Planctomycetota bacterium]
MRGPAGFLLIISGPSGVGKTTIAHAIADRVADTVVSVSTTTRRQTAADLDGVDYTFVDEAEFLSKIERGAFLEHAEVFGRRYGTPRDWVEARLDEGRVVLLEIDVQGAGQVRRAMPDAYGIFILPPSEDELLQRLRDRKREDEAAIQRRFAEAKREIAEAHASGAYDAFVVNRELEAAIDEAVILVEQARVARRG